MRIHLFSFGSSHVVETEFGTSSEADQFFSDYFSSNFFLGSCVIDLFFDEQEEFFPCYPTGEIDIRLSPVVDQILEPWTSNIILVLVFSPFQNNLARTLFQ